MIESPDIIERLRKLIEDGSNFWGYFDRSLVQRNRALEMIEMLTESLPVEVNQARDLVGRNEELIEEARRKAGEIVDEAVMRAEGLVDADNITIEAGRLSEKIREDTDQYINERLSRLEEELTRLLAEVRGGIRAVDSGRKQAPDRDDSDFTLDNS
jgi:vacuolar-type H+-ATPase subunit H